MYKSKTSIKPLVYKNKDGIIKVFEYGGLNSSLEITTAVISGKYPGGDKFAVNTEVETMTYFVISGEGDFKFEEGEEFHITEGDCVFIPKNKGYQVKVEKGKKLEVLMASNPLWTPDQQTIR